ncbi:carnitine metabolism transcriptional regulator CaiF [Edwardsiella tarda]|uniref:CaiF/GrlA family transcriptional regulator n=3 Tax=Edwardsiella tarda TaxID=636 RepID=A0A2A7U6T0_EDWTA|nr:carnitine metabolism transcriptional regulator CaiF [Edwardsiella tarda]PEH73988.1 CaiF/GrlA family transcriptional regulator [Edwardsiella tarda]UAL56013.1 carnitine metabolism transcriptional regulator CaiF [Edwardsiella tarda]UCQ00928.1 carnitine metabolism transcriptional regulator CaiF [Edwardsiella tarda ATCC 15947 = NBRC 105688]UCQ12047.1 carnitine metabolism transcriptional regulator CaiF [Edwardsiella tarda]UCQ18542.1 carnitine metabolism transcriptional regulator CaiF [Edwardsiell
MCTEYAQEPLYLSVARWVMQQQRWVSAREIAQQFDLSTCKAINTVSYILSGVEEITCQTKTVPNQLEGRGCQCQRLIQVTHIDELIATRIRNAINMENEESPSVSEAMARQEAQADAEAVARMAIRVPPDELNREQKWQWMLSKAQRK